MGDIQAARLGEWGGAPTHLHKPARLGREAATAGACFTCKGPVCLPFLLSGLLLCCPAAGQSLPQIELGLCGIFNTYSRGSLSAAAYAAKVALREGYFSDVFETSNFTVNFHPVDTACTATGASKKVLPMLLGQGTKAGRIHSDTEVEPVVGIIGCGCSSPSTVVSQLAAPLFVPMISPAATASALSDKTAHPYFTRVVPPDSIQGRGLAAMVRDLGMLSEDGWSRTTLIYASSTYAEGIVDTFSSAEAVSDITLIKEPLSAQDSFYSYTDDVYETMTETMLRIAGTEPFPRVIISPAKALDLPTFVLMLETGLFTNESAVFSSEGFMTQTGTDIEVLVATRASYLQDPASVSDEEAAFFASKMGDRDWEKVGESLYGMLGLAPKTTGPVATSNEFIEFWTGLTVDKMMDAGYPENYPMDAGYFEESGIDLHTYTSYYFDATTAMLVAIATLLNGGKNSSEVAGEPLLNAILGVNFDGLTGPISMDENGDRLGSYSIINLLESGDVTIGEYNAITDTLTFDITPVFPSNTTTVPRDRPSACPAGSEAEGNACLACTVGYFSPTDGSSCIVCPTGTYAPTTASTACETAVQGTYVGEEGSTEALPCPLGHYSGSLGAASCLACRAGYYSSEGGSTACSYCSQGSFTEADGSSTCEVCNDTRTTPSVAATSASDCICQKGYYQPLGDNTSCRICPVGLECALGSDMTELHLDGGVYPLALAGYMTLASNPLQAYECLVESYCPGGAPGVCAEHRDGQSIACAFCSDGFYPQGDDCRACSGSGDYLLFIGSTLAAILVLSLGVYLISKDTLGQTHGAVHCAVSMGLLFTGLQALGIFDQLAVAWVQPIEGIMELAGLFSFNLDILKSVCIFGSHPTGQFALRLFMLPFFVPIIGLTTWFKADGTAYVAQLVNNVGTCFNVFFISLVICCALPFVCYSHPGGSLWSMRSMPSVLCFEGSDFIFMATLGGIAFLLIPVPFMCLSIYAAWMYPVLIRRHDSFLTLQALRFLYVKFTAQAYFYAPIVLCRSLAISLVPVVLSNAAGQIMSLSVLLLMFLLVQAWLRPWRGQFTNLADACICALLEILLLSGAMIADIGVSDEAIVAVNVLVVVAFILVLLGTLGAIVHSYMSDQFNKYSKFICHHKADAAAQARLLKMKLSVTSIKVFIDSDDLKDLDVLFDIVKTKVTTLVVYLTQDTLKRPWCAGEITTAFKASKARVLLVRLPSFMPLKQREMEDLSAYVDETGCCLMQYGIEWDAVRSAFDDLLDARVTPCLALGHAAQTVSEYEMLSDAVMKGVACSLFEDQAERPSPNSTATGQIVVSADKGDDEASAAAGIFVCKVQEALNREARMAYVCSLVEKDDEDYDALASCVLSARATVIILSQNSLNSFSQLCVILETMRHRAESATQGQRKSHMQSDTYGVIPLMLPGFTFPTDRYYKSILPRFVGEGDEEPEQLVRSLFKLIVSPFPTHSSENALNLEVEKVLHHIPRASSIHSGRTTMASFASMISSRALQSQTQLADSDDEPSSDSEFADTHSV